MIKHIFTIIWNERRLNGWILLEYIFTFCILWFCCDYLCYIVRCHMESTGFDIRNTYTLEIIRKDTDGYISNKENEERIAHTILERVKQHPAITHACFSINCTPYYSGFNGAQIIIHPDSVFLAGRERTVSAEYFDVFNIQLKKGRRFQSAPGFPTNEVLITPDRNGFGEKNGISLLPEDIHFLSFTPGRRDYTMKNVVGVTTKLKNNFLDPYEYNLITSIYNPTRTVSVQYADINIRVRPEETKGFEARFMEEMREQLSVDPYILSGIISTEKAKEEFMEYRGIRNELNSIYTLTFFIVINIFLGITGTFWYRSESRKNEIGIRIAMGSTQSSIRKMMYLETIFLLFFASLFSINICIHIGQANLLELAGLPTGNRIQVNSGWEQDVFNYIITFLFLAITSISAVWYPIRKASGKPAAEALRNE